jgi:uncharacterized protein (TIGR02118 family)
MAQVRMSVYYPQGEDESFDHDYYRDVHIPLAQQTWHPVNTQIDRGLNGPFVAAVHFTFASREAMDEALKAEGTAAIMADVKNYTSITPQMQVSEVVS